MVYGDMHSLPYGKRCFSSAAGLALLSPRVGAEPWKGGTGHRSERRGLCAWQPPGLQPPSLKQQQVKAAAKGRSCEGVSLPIQKPTGVQRFQVLPWVLRLHGLILPKLGHVPCPHLTCLAAVHSPPQCSAAAGPQTPRLAAQSKSRAGTAQAPRPGQGFSQEIWGLIPTPAP